MRYFENVILFVLVFCYDNFLNDTGFAMDADKVIDVTGKVCPLPLITMAKEVRTMQKGQVLCIVGDDPIFEESVIDFCREGVHELLETHREGKKVTILFQV